MKYDKKKCKKCKWHGSLVGSGATGTKGVYCNYGSLHRCSCLKRIKGHIVDRRGGDFNNCLLYEKGKAIRDIGSWHETHMNDLGIGGKNGRVEERPS